MRCRHFPRSILAGAVLFGALAFWAGLAEAQTIRLPSVVPEYDLPAIEPFFPAVDGEIPASVIGRLPTDGEPLPPDIEFQPGLTPEMVAPDEGVLDLQVQPAPQASAKLRDGSFQWAAIAGTWMPRFGDDGLGIANVEAKAVFGLPFLTVENPLIITPVYGAYFFDGPTESDLPARVYDAYIEFRHLRKVTGNFMLDLQVTPGWYSDYSHGEWDSLRVGARALGIYDSSPTSRWVFGAVYLDRDDIHWLPAGGWIWTPTPDWNLELIFPKPKVAWRLGVDGRLETWLYVGGDLGGSAWTIERADGRPDEVAYRDIRLLAGIDRKIGHFSMAKLEFGYVLNRELDYTSRQRDVELDDTFLIRALLGF